ncbi:MAG: conserved hypothetical secreted protein, partial [Solirubrobacterales bacterium]|nr:conserved hypothetical secreted protein [Solirubrobacterales bacterium]
MLPRRIALLASIAVIAGAAFSGAAKAQPADDACATAAPSAAICIGAQKPVEAAAAVCRDAGAPEDACAAAPVGHTVRPSQLAAYAGSWLHRAAQFQFALGDSVPLRDAQWLGTHNSFNADANGVTVSHTDNNQQLTLAQQLDGDIRALELDLHFVSGSENGLGSRVVRVCHGRGADQYHAGCTTEPLLTAVLPEINGWLGAHPGQVIMLYLEDHLDEDAGYKQAVDALDAGLRGPDGTPRVYRPAAPSSNGCTELPLGLTRADVRAAGASVVLVGNCRAGWSGRVFGWDAGHVESGSTPDYAAYPACDATYDRSVYAAKLVRYFEDSTWLSAAVDPASTPADHRAGELTPAKVAAMTACGVNLFGFDQFDPNDGRVEASIWSWAPGEPGAAGACAVQRAADGRWITGDCGG